MVPVYSSEPTTTEFAMPWLIQPDHNVTLLLEVHGTPSVVLLGVDGLIAGGPVVGEDAVREFVGEVIEQLHGATD